MATSIARLIRAGRNKPKRAGNPTGTNGPRPRSLRGRIPASVVRLISRSAIGVTAPGNGVSNGHAVTAGPGGAAGGVAVAAAVAVSSGPLLSSSTVRKKYDNINL